MENTLLAQVGTTEIIELDDMALDSVTGGYKAPIDDANNCDCNGNCGC